MINPKSITFLPSTTSISPKSPVCLTFNKIFNLDDKSIRLLIKQINPSILGVSLKGSPINQQRRVLSLAQRDYAERAFAMLTNAINDEENSIIKSQQKVIESIGSLNKMGLLKI